MSSCSQKRQLGIFKQLHPSVFRHIMNRALIMDDDDEDDDE